MSVQRELDKLSKKINADARKNALPNKKTGALDRSFKASAKVIDEDNMIIQIEEKHYGIYLNNKTQFMDEAIEKNLKNNMSPLLQSMADKLLEDLLKD